MSKIPATDAIRIAVIQAPEAKIADILSLLSARGLAFNASTVATIRSDTLATLRCIRAAKALKAAEQPPTLMEAAEEYFEELAAADAKLAEALPELTDKWRCKMTLGDAIAFFTNEGFLPTPNSEKVLVDNACVYAGQVQLAREGKHVVITWQRYGATDMIPLPAGAQPLT